jgi:hypothetical protein
MKLVNMDIINNNWLKNQINEYIYHILSYVSIFFLFMYNANYMFEIR